MAATPDVPTRYLSEDLISPNGQRFALVSFVGPNCNQKNEKLGMKIRGCFANVDEARAHVKKIQAMDNDDVDIFLLEVGKWALIPPTADDETMDVEYQEKYLQDLMESYKESQLKAKETFKNRVEAIKQEGLDKNLLPDEVLPKPKVEDEAGPSSVPKIEEIA